MTSTIGNCVNNNNVFVDGSITPIHDAAQRSNKRKLSPNSAGSVNRETVIIDDDDVDVFLPNNKQSKLENTTQKNLQLNVLEAENKRLREELQIQHAQAALDRELLLKKIEILKQSISINLIELSDSSGNSDVDKDDSSSANIPVINIKVNDDKIPILVSDSDSTKPLTNFGSTLLFTRSTSTDSDSLPFKHHAVREEFTCTICCSLFLFPVTLECGHSFCEDCLNSWFGQNHDRCPNCRAIVRSSPIKSVHLDNAVVQVLSTEEKEERKKLIHNREKKLHHAEVLTEQLARSVRNARARGKSFLYIDRIWKPKETQTFLDAVRKYHGSARLEYCKLVELTPDFIQSANLPESRNACKNLGISTNFRSESPTSSSPLMNGKKSPDNKQLSSLETIELRRRLWLFLYHNCTIA